MSGSIKQRLSLFLDGTWNTEDDNTNVLRTYHSTINGKVSSIASEPTKEIIQKRYYDRGVGTGLLDSIMGGGFGFGLESNVREAYNWLVENYNDGDEIYIFGFSRGAYTARSLVGLISACGLVKRGAPLTISQLWDGYSFISRHRSINASSWWKKRLSKMKYNFRRISILKGKTSKGKEWKINKKALNKTELLIAHWSVKVEITYLGIFDTVGAMGTHALGIPGVSSKLDRSHNLYPSSIIKSCRHAIAIDEHRSSFRLTPLLQFVSNKDKEVDRYNDNIEQRWFVGAHSNIGGGYPSNTLSVHPSDWIIKGAKNQGLEINSNTEDIPKNIRSSQLADVRDSFSEMMGAAWADILREKRNYRIINREDNVRNSYTLRTINEKIDKSVLDFANEYNSYAPPNLIAYLRRTPNKDSSSILLNRNISVSWPGEILSYEGKKSWLRPRLMIIIWSLFVAIGFKIIINYFYHNPIQNSTCALSLLATVLVLVDWGEYQLNLYRTFSPKAVIHKNLWNVLYWIRLLSVPACLVGMIYTMSKFVNLLWLSKFTSKGIFILFHDFLSKSFQLKYCIPLLCSFIVMAVLDNFGQFKIPKYVNQRLEINKIDINLIPKKFHKINVLTITTAVISAVFVGFTTIYSRHGYLEFLNDDKVDIQNVSRSLLLIYILVVVFIFTFKWVVKPLGKANGHIGSIVSLQNATSNFKIKLLFDVWVKSLSRSWVNLPERICLDTARMKEIVKESLWRDLIGFIPVYSIILGSILYTGNNFKSCEITGLDCSLNELLRIPVWLVLILIVAIADILENIVHLKHLKNYPRNESSNLLIYFGLLMTTIKYIGFFISMLLSLVIICTFVVKILTNVSHSGEWVLATIISYAVIIGATAYIIKKTKKIVNAKLRI